MFLFSETKSRILDDHTNFAIFATNAYRYEK